MAYLDLLQSEGIESRFLVVVKPRRAVTFTLDSGAQYVSDFDFGEVVAVTVNSSPLSAATALPLSSGEFFYDVTNEKVYVRLSDDSDPALKTMVATYEIHVGTDQIHFHRNPLDTDTRTVFYEPLINENTFLRSTLANDIFGFLPQQTSSLRMSNTPQFWQKHAFDSSFNKIQVAIYHSLGTEIKSENIKLIFDGLGGNTTLTDKDFQIRLLDRADIFTNEYRNPVADSFYDSSNFTALDETFENAPIRYVYGRVDGFEAVNINKVDQNQTTSDNRQWACIGEQSDLPSITATCQGGGSATVTPVDDAAGIGIGDALHFNRGAGSDEYLLVTDVNYSTDEVTHSSLSGGAMSNGDTLERPFVGRVNIIQNDTLYIAFPSRDYTVNTSIAQGISGFTFTNNFEANIGMSTLSPGDRVSARIYGKKVDNIELNASTFGTNDQVSGNAANIIVVLYDLLKTSLGLTESQLNLTSFTSAQSSVVDAVGIAIPSSAQSNFPTYKDVIIEAIQTGLLRVYFDFDNLLKVEQIGPHGSANKTIADDEMLVNKARHQFEYDDIYSDILVEYDENELSPNPNEFESFKRSVNASSDNAKYVHDIDREFQVLSRHFKSVDAQRLADRLSYVLGERKNFIKLSAKNRFFSSTLQEILTVTRSRLPLGLAFDQDTDLSDNFTVIQTEKSLRQVNITADDQKGIQDNSGSW